MSAQYRELMGEYVWCFGVVTPLTAGIGTRIVENVWSFGVVTPLTARIGARITEKICISTYWREHCDQSR